jgi:hypothetical protein
MDVYGIITEKIITLLEQGVVPWRRPWTGTGSPRNLVSMKPYRGINYFLLSSKYISPYWLTMRQADELGGHVRKGEESTAIVFWGLIAVVVVGVIIWPHLWPAKASIPEIAPTHFAEPPKPITAPSIAKLMPLAPVQATPTPKAQPTPCQPCIEAANEILARYLAAIRTGAGPDNREEKPNVYESPQVVPNAPAPVWRPIPSANGQSHF